MGADQSSQYTQESQFSHFDLTDCSLRNLSKTSPTLLFATAKSKDQIIEPLSFTYEGIQSKSNQNDSDPMSSYYSVLTTNRELSQLSETDRLSLQKSITRVSKDQLLRQKKVFYFRLKNKQHLVYCYGFELGLQQSQIQHDPRKYQNKANRLNEISKSSKENNQRSKLSLHKTKNKANREKLNADRSYKNEKSQHRPSLLLQNKTLGMRVLQTKYIPFSKESFPKVQQERRMSTQYSESKSNRKVKQHTITLYFQNITEKFINLYELPVKEGLLILQRALIGYDLLFNMFGYFSPEMSQIMRQGDEWKVWIDANPVVTKVQQKTNRYGNEQKGKRHKRYNSQLSTLESKDQFCHQIVHLFDVLRDPQNLGFSYTQFIYGRDGLHYSAKKQHCHRQKTFEEVLQFVKSQKQLWVNRNKQSNISVKINQYCPQNTFSKNTRSQCRVQNLQDKTLEGYQRQAPFQSQSHYPQRSLMLTSPLSGQQNSSSVYSFNDSNFDSAKRQQYRYTHKPSNFFTMANNGSSTYPFNQTSSFPSNSAFVQNKGSNATIYLNRTELSQNQMGLDEQKQPKLREQLYEAEKRLQAVYPFQEISRARKQLPPINRITQKSQTDNSHQLSREQSFYQKLLAESKSQMSPSKMFSNPAILRSPVLTQHMKKNKSSLGGMSQKDQVLKRYCQRGSNFDKKDDSKKKSIAWNDNISELSATMKQKESQSSLKSSPNEKENNCDGYSVSDQATTKITQFQNKAWWYKGESTPTHSKDYNYSQGNSEIFSGDAAKRQSREVENVFGKPGNSAKAQHQRINSSLVSSSNEQALTCITKNTTEEIYPPEQQFRDQGMMGFNKVKKGHAHSHTHGRTVSEPYYQGLSQSNTKEKLRVIETIEGADSIEEPLSEPSSEKLQHDSMNSQIKIKVSNEVADSCSSNSSSSINAKKSYQKSSQKSDWKKDKHSDKKQEKAASTIMRNMMSPAVSLWQTSKTAKCCHSQEFDSMFMMGSSFQSDLLGDLDQETKGIYFLPKPSAQNYNHAFSNQKYDQREQNLENQSVQQINMQIDRREELAKDNKGIQYIKGKMNQNSECMAQKNGVRVSVLQPNNSVSSIMGQTNECLQGKLQKGRGVSMEQYLQNNQGMDLELSILNKEEQTVFQTVTPPIAGKSRINKIKSLSAFKSNGNLLRKSGLLSKASNIQTLKSIKRIDFDVDIDEEILQDLNKINPCRRFARSIINPPHPHPYPGK